MHDCDGMAMYMGRAGTGADDDEPTGNLRAPLAEGGSCPIQHVAACVLAHRFDDNTEDGHLNDLDLAVFATHGLDAPNADSAVEHLSVCRECRQQFSDIRSLLEQHDDLIYAEAPRPRMPDRPFMDQVRLVFSDAKRSARAVAAFFSWIAEWAMLLIVLFQVAAAYLAAADEIGRSTATELLGIAPRDPVRLWLIAAACLCLAIFFRWLGAQLYHRAVEQERR